jgi:hypothetical protein
MKGEETEPGATIFNVFAATIDTMHEPLFLPIDFDANVNERIGRVSVSGVLDIESEPIRNPVTGATHRARIEIPHGFEYASAEVASGTTRTGNRAAIPLAWSNAHAHFVDLHWTRQGVVR